MLVFVNVGWGKNEKILMPLLLLFLFFSRHLFGCIGTVKRASSAVESDDYFFFLFHIKVFEGEDEGGWGKL